MATENRYRITLTGISSLLMHKDNLAFEHELNAWEKDPKNKQDSKAGDDRTPAWRWISYLYEDGEHVCLDSDNIMTMLREAGKKVQDPKSKKATMKAKTQYGLLLPNIHVEFRVGGDQIPLRPILDLKKESDFGKQVEAVERLGFELLEKRAAIKMSKHVRIRPMFKAGWEATFELIVPNEEDSCLTEEMLRTLFSIAGDRVGLCDWRPGCKTPGPFGRFTAKVKKIS